MVRSRQHQRRHQQAGNRQKGENRSRLSGGGAGCRIPSSGSRFLDRPGLELFFFPKSLRRSKACFLPMRSRAVLLVHERSEKADFLAAKEAKPGHPSSVARFYQVPLEMQRVLREELLKYCASSGSILRCIIVINPGGQSSWSANRQNHSPTAMFPDDPFGTRPHSDRRCSGSPYRFTPRCKGRSRRVLDRSQSPGIKGVTDYPRARNRRAAGSGARGIGADAFRAFLFRCSAGSRRLGSDGGYFAVRASVISRAVRLPGRSTATIGVHRLKCSIRSWSPIAERLPCV